MRLNELVDLLALEHLTPAVSLDRPVTGGYCGDLLSDVLASARPDEVWITIQRHINTVAVAKVTGIAAIIVCKGIRPNDDVIHKAEEDGIVLLSARESAFEVAGRVHRLLFPEGR
ncbi:MAG: hypothetical protein DRI37_05215 [Chloroflexi bacterium]|nr:MAG: hypothetical protein DRI37_05215 [Chloroflexota bacterium]